MSQTSRHIAFDRLLDYADGELSAAERMDVIAHLADCDQCGGIAASINSLLQTMQTDDTQPAPTHVINRAIRTFRTERLTSAPRTSAGSLRQRLVAALRFDSAQQPFAVGQRAGHISERELLFGAGDRTIEVRVDRAESGWRVGGQILGTCSGGEAVLQGDTGVASTELNELCEFSLPPVDEGIYLLILRLDDVEVEVPGLELRA